MAPPTALMPDRPRLILASESPRRRGLLENIGLPFEVVRARVDETSVSADSPRALALKLACLKASEAAGRMDPPALVLAADTVVVLGEEALGKPRDRADAARMLRALRGSVHRVITAVALAEVGGGCEVDARESTVTMRTFSDRELETYLNTGEPMDKAGAYAIQGEGARLIEGHTGCWCNVVGLPLILALRLLRTQIDVRTFPVPCTCESWAHVRPGPLPYAK